MKSKLFKEFHKRDLNEYVYAILSNEFYYGVRTIVPVLARFGLFRWRTTETQYLQVIKFPPSMVELLGSISAIMHLNEEVANGIINPSDTEYVPTLEEVRDALKRDIIVALGEMKESELTQNPENEKAIGKFYADRLLQIYDQFALSWTNPVVEGYLAKNWVFLMQVYAGVATRNLWFARIQDDVVNLMELKVFGSEKDNEVVRDSRLLLDKEIIDAYLERVQGE